MNDRRQPKPQASFLNFIKNPFYLATILLPLLFIPPLPVWSQLPQNFTSSLTELDKITTKLHLFSYPVRKLNYPPPQLTATAYLIKDIDSKVTMAEKNKDQPLAMASLTKLMTIWTALKVFPPHQVFIIKKDGQEIDGQTIDLKRGEKYSLESLIAAMLIHSANDAAINLALNYPNGIKGFVQQMNRQAKLLHMEKSHFTNPVGYDDKNHYTTAFDLSLLVDELLKNKLILTLAQTPAMEITPINSPRIIPLITTNQLLEHQNGVFGLKTGWTPKAKECLISIFQSPQNKWYTIILLGSQDRFGETLLLKNWVDNNFRWQKVK